MKKLFATLLAAVALFLLGAPSAMAAFEQIYVCGAINDQGWKPGSGSVITLSKPDNGWFILNVTQEGEFKISSTVGATDDDWAGFDTGVAKFQLADKEINTVADKESVVTGNSSIPEGTKVLYVSSDLKKAAASDGIWVPEAYVATTNPDIPTGAVYVKVDISATPWTAVKAFYWGGITNSWPGANMKDEGNGIWSLTFPANSTLPENIIFNNGASNGENQSIDFVFEANRTYVLRSKDAASGKWTEEEGGDDPVITPTGNFVKVDVSRTGWDTTVFAHYWEGDAVSAWPGVAMTNEAGNVWVITFEGDKLPGKILFHNGIGDQTVDLAFENKKTYVLDHKDPAQEDKWVIDGGQSGVSGLSNTLPVLYINIYKTNPDGTFKTDANGNKIFENYQLQVEEIDKVYRPGEYWLDMNGCTTVPGENIGSAEEPLPLEMKGRGNWTRKGFAKKPFKLKLGKKQVLLGMGEKSKHWAILAHADDNYAYLRNFSGFNLGHRIGLPWTPSQQPVEVVINGDYRGLYFLTESIRVGDGRVPIQELEDNATDQNLISGGYLIELDNYDEDNQISMEEKHCAPGSHYYDVLRVTFDTPEEYSEVQKRFIGEQFAVMNDYVGKANTAEGNGLWAYLDLDDAARYYIVMEILSHTESYHGSTYLFRDRGEGQKWHFSPIWDMGNAFNGSTSAFLFDCDPFGNTWIPSLACNAKFMDKVKKTWEWFMKHKYDDFMNDIDTYCSTIAAAAKADHARWAGVNPPSGGQDVCDNSNIDERKKAAKDHINSKINWLRGQWGGFTNDFYAEPDKDDTEPAPLPDYALSGIEDITSPDAVDAPAVYYNLQGIRVANPVRGQIYIRTQAGKGKTVVY